MTKLINRAIGSADYLGMTYSDIGEVEVESNAIQVEKSADKTFWTGYTPLTYTVLITNNDPDTVSGGLLENVMFEDIIDPEIAVLDTDNVRVDGVLQMLDTDFTYNATTGKLYFIRMADIPPAQTMTVEYIVRRRP